MKFFLRLIAIWFLLTCARPALSQEAMGPKIDNLNIQFVGPAGVNEQFIRSHIQLKAGYTYLAAATESDIHALYATGQFYNIRVAIEQVGPNDVNLTYIVQVKPRLTEIKIVGNKRMRESKIRKKNLLQDWPATRRRETLYRLPGHHGLLRKKRFSRDDGPLCPGH